MPKVIASSSRPSFPHAECGGGGAFAICSRCPFPRAECGVRKWGGPSGAALPCAEYGAYQPTVCFPRTGPSPVRSARHGSSPRFFARVRGTYVFFSGVDAVRRAEGGKTVRDGSPDVSAGDLSGRASEQLLEGGDEGGNRRVPAVERHGGDVLSGFELPARVEEADALSPAAEGFPGLALEQAKVCLLRKCISSTVRSIR